MLESVCPQCGATIPPAHGYVGWCDRCNWNVQPHQPDRPQTLVGSLYVGLGDRFGRSLFEELAHAQSLEPGFTPSLALAAILAVAVHAITLILALGGLWLIVAHWFNLFALLGGLLFLGMAWYLAPRPPAFPRHVLARDRYSALYGIADRVADALHAPRPDAIVVATRFNAGYGRSGWRRRHVITLGLPLLAILDDRQTVALIAHELAHAVNHDTARTALVGSALGALGRWYFLLIPARSATRSYGIAHLATMFAHLVQHLLAILVRLVALAMSHLLFRASQRAEYLADHLAAQVAGTEAMLSLLAVLQLGSLVEFTVQRTSMNVGSGDLFADLRERVTSMPARERQRLRAVAHLEASRLDATHPPTGFRVRLLEARPIALPAVTLPGTVWREAQEELAQFEQPIAVQLLDNYRARLYR